MARSSTYIFVSFVFGGYPGGYYPLFLRLRLRISIVYNTLYQSRRRHLTMLHQLPSFLSQQLNQSHSLIVLVFTVTTRLYQHRATKYTNHHGATYSPRKYSQHTSPIFFFHKNHFPKIFWAPFQGFQGLLPTIFEFPFSRFITSNFFPPFNLYSHFLLHFIQPPDDYSTSS